MEKLTGINKYCYLIYLLACIFSGNAPAAPIEYRPQTIEPAKQDWFWTEIEALTDKGFRSIANGPNGSIFFGTERGIYHYDGYSFKHYGVADGLDASAVVSMYQAKSGRVYAATRVALYTLEDNRWLKLHDGTFHYYNHIGFTENPNGVVWLRSDAGVIKIKSLHASLELQFGKAINGIAADKNNTLWVTLIDHDVLYECPNPTVFTKPEKHCTRHQLVNKKGLKLYPLVDSKNQLWLFTKQPGLGVFRYDLGRRIWEHFDFENLNGAALESADGSLFFTSENRLYKYSRGNLEFIKQLDIHGPRLLESPDGRLWVGSLSEKVYYINRSHQSFVSYKDLLYQGEAENGQQWFLSKNGEIISHTPKQNRWLNHRDPHNIITTPVALLVTKTGQIIVAGSENKNAAISVYNGKIWRKYIIRDFSPTIFYDSLLQANDGTIYMGGAEYDIQDQGYSGGLLKIKLTPDGRADIQRLVPPNYPHIAQRIIQTADSSIWIVEKTLFKLEEHRAVPVDMPDTFKPGRLLHGASGGNSTIWLARFSYGLFALNGAEWTHYPTDETTGNNAITNILPTKDGRLYAATFEGIMYFDGETWNRNFLPKAFKMRRRGGTIQQDSNGALWLSYSSIYWFLKAITDRNIENIDFPPSHTIRYMPDSAAPIVDLQSHTNEVPWSGNQFITWQGHDKWNVTPREHILYSYKLNNTDWSPFEPETRITLSELRDGTHEFQLRAKDPAGNISQEPARVQFTVLPPIWKQTWFLLTMGLLLATIAALIALIIRLHEKHLIALDKLRLDFYTNITHELRTPLTIILGPLEKLRKQISNPEQGALLEMAMESSRRLRKLVDQVLDIRKIETGNDSLNLEQGDPILFLTELSSYYLPLANEKQIQLIQELDDIPIIASFDKDKLQKILDNLLINAIKYSPQASQIVLRASVTEEINAKKRYTLVVEVEDTGIGIPPKAQKRIFSRYYREKQEDTQGGFGIGLAHVKQLVDVCAGHISILSPVDSNTQKGTRFRVTIPLSIATTHTPAISDAIIEKNAAESIASSCEKNPLLLIIEDNAHIRDYLQLELKNDYVILEANNGKQGITVAKQFIPDIIISDVIMPELDGLECCKQLKSNHTTSHIPIILLTARRSRDQELVGLETGADDYLSKPIDIDLLKARLLNQLENRKKTHELIEASPPMNVKSDNTSKIEKAFVKQLLKLTENQISNPNFDIIELSTQLGFSRTTLYRKIKAAFGQSPSQFLNSIRLKKAAALLESGKYSVTDVTALVGFQSLSYFSRLFREEFGQPPSAVLQRRNEAPELENP